MNVCVAIHHFERIVRRTHFYQNFGASLQGGSLSRVIWSSFFATNTLFVRIGTIYFLEWVGGSGVGGGTLK